MDVTMESAPADKIRLFRAMFRGREDVCAAVCEREERQVGLFASVCDRMDAWAL